MPWGLPAPPLAPSCLTHSRASYSALICLEQSFVILIPILVSPAPRYCSHRLSPCQLASHCKLI